MPKRKKKNPAVNASGRVRPITPSGHLAVSDTGAQVQGRGHVQTHFGKKPAK